MEADSRSSPSPQPIQPIPHRPSPWDPYRVFAFMFIVSTIVVGIILSLNWRRLGKPTWVYRSMILSLAIGFLAIVMAIGWIALLVRIPDVPEAVLLAVPFIALGVNFGYTSALARLQHGAYKQWKARGDPALASHVYNLRGATAFGSLIAVVVFLGGTFVIPRVSFPSPAPPPGQSENSLPEIPRIPLAEAKSAFDTQAALFIDVRSSSQYADGHIPGAMSIPLMSLEDAIADLRRESWIITYCT